MPSQSELPKSELQIARIVWRLKSATVRDVLNELPAARKIDFKTVQTYLRRLEAKGYLKSKRQGRSNVYVPKAQPQRVVRDVVDDFMDRLFDGEAIPLLQHVIHDRGLTEEELRKLRDMLDQLEAENNDS